MPIETTPSLSKLDQQLQTADQENRIAQATEVPEAYAHLVHNNAAPVELWAPEFCGDMDLVIKANGQWFHDGELIKRNKLVEQFSRILRKEKNDYFLVTPVEKVRIQVEKAPFLVVRMEQHTINQQVVLRFQDKVGNAIVLSEQHPLWVKLDSKTGEPSPYIRIRSNLNALIHRSVYYELIAMAEEREISTASGSSTDFIIHSAGHEFSLGSVSADEI